MKQKSNGLILYKGPSMIDGKPIVVIAVGLKIKSSNTKTGAMLQTYIIRSRIAPLRASKIGADYSVCGNCPMRGVAVPNDPERKQAKERPCYVRLDLAPTGVYKTFKAGRYPEADGMGDVARAGRGRRVRLGTYGDPAAVPPAIWASLLSASAGHTGYSHQSLMPGACFLPEFFMASADSLKDAQAFWKKGIRTFRVGAKTEKAAPGEILCPASEEAGRITTCEKCGLCAGSNVKAKSIFIPAHGNGAGLIINAAGVS